METLVLRFGVGIGMLEDARKLLGCVVVEQCSVGIVQPNNSLCLQRSILAWRVPQLCNLYYDYYNYYYYCSS